MADGHRLPAGARQLAGSCRRPALGSDPSLSSPRPRLVRRDDGDDAGVRGPAQADPGAWLHGRSPGGVDGGARRLGRSPACPRRGADRRRRPPHRLFGHVSRDPASEHSDHAVHLSLGDLQRRLCADLGATGRDESVGPGRHPVAHVLASQLSTSKRSAWRRRPTRNSSRISS